jgi:hypothetical protein
MDSKEKLRLKDLPTIDELRERFEAREKNLRRHGVQNSTELLKSKNAVAYQFVFENLPLLESKDQELVNQLGKNMFRYGFLSITLPTIINIGLARMTQNRIYDLHYLMRWSFRLAIYVTPIFLYTDYLFGSYTRVSMYLTDKYSDRVELFLKVGDVRIINPNYRPENNDN